MTGRDLSTLVVGTALVLACKSSSSESKLESPPLQYDAAVTGESPVTDAAIVDAAPAIDAAIPTGPAVVVVTDRAALDIVERSGGSFADLVPAAAYTSIAEVLRTDVETLAAGDSKAGVGIKQFPHRLFDTVWLDKGRFELVGVVNRLDRLPLTPGRCGDTRLVFRLAYSTEHGGKPLASRLPMTIAVVLAGPAADTGCLQAARRWKRPTPGAAFTGAATGAWLVGETGPLGRGVLASARVERVLTNVQAVRWPSGVHPDLGGHTEYLFREFAPKGDGTLAPIALLSVPDTERIRKNRSLRAKLLAWLRKADTVQAIDRGELQLPPELRATMSRGVTPRGFSRRGNRPFRLLIAPSKLVALDLSDNQVATTPETLLRRMDELTCAGCHQARTIAGFHLLGEDGDDVAGGNALAVPTSPHLSFDIARRKRIVESLAAGESPSLVPPFAERPPGSPGVAGAPCGLGDDGLSSWTCNRGLECRRIDSPDDDVTVGMCASPEIGALGDPCDIGPIASHRNPRRDRVPVKEEAPCAEGLTCKISRQGFPAGQCASKCSTVPSGGSCTLIAGAGFNECLLAGKPYSTCVGDTATRMGVPRCSAKVPCRDDYVCVRAVRGGAGCVPPYFLFQLRVDGHPSLLPRATEPPKPDGDGGPNQSR